MMPRIVAFLVACFCIWTTPAHAQSAAQCAPYEEQTVAMDFAVARQMAALAAAAAGDTPTYAKWFGTYSDADAERVRTVLKEIHAKLVSEQLALVCAGKSNQTCPEAYAWVWPVTGVIRLCHAHFRLSSMAGAHDGAIRLALRTHNTHKLTTDQPRPRSLCVFQADRVETPPGAERQGALDPR
jgi:peptidyl-Lys metalloendopeptidase